MKKKADPTIPVACRICYDLHTQLLQGAADMEMSQAQYISYLLTIALYGTGTQALQERLTETTQQLETAQRKLQEEQALIWKQEPYAALLEKVLHNERVLEELHSSHGSDSVPVEQLGVRGYHADVFLTGAMIAGKLFRCTGRYGWAYTDKSKTKVTILNQVKDGRI